MSAPPIKDLGKSSHCQVLLSRLRQLREENLFCDVVFDNGGPPLLRAHLCVLASFSPFFSSGHYESRPDPHGGRAVWVSLSELTDLDEESEYNCHACLSDVLDFLYTGRVKMTPDHLKHVLRLAKRLGLEDLVRICCKFAGLNGGLDSALQTSNRDDSEEAKKKYTDLKELDRNTLCKVECFNRKPDGKMAKLTCGMCPVAFETQEKLNLHKLVLHSRKFICLTCKCSSFKLSAIVNHLLEESHFGDACSICLFTPKDKKLLQEHITDHKNTKPFSCDTCKTRFKLRNSWRDHVLSHQNGKLNCSVCQAEFKTPRLLKQHESLHFKERKSVCDVCGFSTIFPSYLERHKLTHNGSKPYKCSFKGCSYSCNKTSNLKQHLESMHSTSKNYKCKICGVLFSFDKNLRRHVKSAHGTTSASFSCSLCPYTSQRLDKLKSHCRFKHKTVAEVTEVKKMLESAKTLHKLTVNSLLPRYKKLDSSWKNTPKKAPSVEAQPGDHDRVADELSKLPHNVRQTVFLSETTGELSIVTENDSQPIPVASVTSTNMLTIGNFREGTGSVTLNESTGILTINNINSETTGAVFLNESTGEMSYINLNKENPDVPYNHLKEVEKTCAESPSRMDLDNLSLSDDEFPFGSAEYDFLNDDSLDGDDFDSFEPFPLESPLDIHQKQVPHLNEATGELSFDILENEVLPESTWDRRTQETCDPEMFLNEVTGEMMLNNYFSYKS